MSIQRPEVKDALEERSGFFIDDLDYDWGEDDHVDHHQLILQKADALASENCLKEAIDCFSMAMRYGCVRPEQLSTLVDCIVRNFKRKVSESDALSERKQGGLDNVGDMFDCPNCHSFLGEPVTIACGHSYCKRCLQHRLLSKCKLCSEIVRDKPGEPKVNVILCGLLDKWFPNELKRSKTIGEIEDLSRRKLYKAAVSLATNLIKSGKCVLSFS